MLVHFVYFQSTGFAVLDALPYLLSTLEIQKMMAKTVMTAGSFSQSPPGCQSASKEPRRYRGGDSKCDEQRETYTQFLKNPSESVRDPEVG
jgi:hypothetical protein